MPMRGSDEGDVVVTTAEFVINTPSGVVPDVRNLLVL